MQAVAIVVLCIASAVVYGILHDQVTARVCVEYFTIGHPPVFATESPTLLGIGWGIIATWWVGLLLGIPLALAARVGRRPKRGVRSLARPVATLLLAMGACALIRRIPWVSSWAPAASSTSWNRWLHASPRPGTRGSWPTYGRTRRATSSVSSVVSSSSSACGDPVPVRSRTPPNSALQRTRLRRAAELSVRPGPKTTMSLMVRDERWGVRDQGRG